MRLCRDYGDCGQNKQIFESKLREMTSSQELQIAAQPAQPSATNPVAVVKNQPGGIQASSAASAAASAANLGDILDFRPKKTKQRR